MKKHIARVANTDQRVAVVFLQIPGRPDHSLVVPTDNLPDRVHDALMTILESAEAQTERDFANVLARRVLPDTGQNMMEALHQNGFLVPVHVDQVVMYPLPNMPFPLRKLLETMEGSQTLPPATVDYNSTINKYNPHVANAAATNIEDRQAIAQGLLFQAEDLKRQAETLLAEAARKEEQAAAYLPKKTQSVELKSETPQTKTRRKQVSKA